MQRDWAEHQLELRRKDRIAHSEHGWSCAKGTRTRLMARIRQAGFQVDAYEGMLIGLQ